MANEEQVHRERATDLGVVRISNDSIATIASLAAMEVKGVCKMGGGKSRALIDALLKRFSSRGVKVQMKDGEVKLTVSIIVEYGVDIPRVADEVQENVKRAVEKMAGLIPEEVDVIVEGVRALQGGVFEKERKI